eukprot:Skav203329  [mRNA]  locus=scaffold284:318972:321333:+ [translate_table: standard]
MHVRQSDFASGVPTFVWLSADASPQGTLEYYIILEDRISRAFAAEIVEATPDERDHWCRAGYLKTTTLPCTVLGSGRATAAAKFEALTHSVILDAMHDGDPSNVAKYGESVISFCSDFGAESNIASLPSICVQDVLKNNVQNSDGMLRLNSSVIEQRFGDMQQDDDGIIEDVMLVEDAVVHDPGHDSEPKYHFGMTSSLMIPGVKHMFDNVHKELVQSLSHYTTFCFAKDGPFARYRKLISFWEGGQLKSIRWSSLVTVIRALLLREDALRSGWNKDLFGDIGTTSIVDAALTSPLFWKYCHFLNNVAGAVDVGSSYCEGCDCHEHQGLQHNSFQVRRNHIELRLRSAIEDDSNRALPYPPSCPLKGRRSPELATGAFKKFIKDILVITKDLLDDFRGELSDSDWQVILALNASQDTIVSNLVLKSSYWDVLPWRLCGLGSNDFEEARACGRTCLRLWDKMSSESKDSRPLHHSLTRRFLDPDTWHSHSQY